MGERTSRYVEIVVRVVDKRGRAADESRTNRAAENGLERKRAYDALIYTDLTIPDLTPPSHDCSSNQPPQLAELPLAGVETIVVRWSRYREYLTSFIAGEKAAFNKLWDILPSRRGAAPDPLIEIRNILFEPPPKALEAMFQGKLETDRPVRVWWSTPISELVHLPWELLAYGERDAGGGENENKLSFVRGTPPKTAVPRVPVSGPLRLALIYHPQQMPDGLTKALDTLPKPGDGSRGVEVTHMTGPALASLQRAVREDYELVHIIADGSISLAYEGILYLRKPSSKEAGQEQSGPLKRRILRIALYVARRLRSILPDELINRLNDRLYTKLDIETCTPGQLSALTRGSRVTVISFSVPKSDDADPARMDSFLLPSVYKAFASLGNSRLPLPNIVVPLGATSDEQLTKFWNNFYTQLAKTVSVEEAMAEGQEGNLAVPMALFLRQRLGREFVALDTARDVSLDKNPLQINAELQASRDLMEQLQAVDLKYESLTDNVTETSIVEGESVRQARLEQELTTWTQLQEGE